MCAVEVKLICKYTLHDFNRPVYLYDLGVFCSPTFSACKNKKQKNDNKKF